MSKRKSINRCIIALSSNSYILTRKFRLVRISYIKLNIRINNQFYFL